MRKSFNQQTLAVLLLCLAAFLLRAWGIASSDHFSLDEGLQVPAARHYPLDGQINAINWHFPRVGIMLLSLIMKIIGDNPVGWRSLDLALGTVSVWLVYLIGRQVFDHHRPALIAAFLLAMDPLHILLSRTALDDMPAGAFLLAAVYFLLRYPDGGAVMMLVGGVGAGLSLGCKPYAFFPLALLVLFVVRMRGRQPDVAPWERPFMLAAGILLPATLIMLSYYPWFGRGYDLRDFGALFLDSLRSVRNFNFDRMANGPLMRETGAAWEWFLHPRLSALDFGGTGGWGNYILLINNPPVWCLTLPSLVFTVVEARKQGNERFLLVCALFAATYLPLLAVGRPIFFYSALPLLPFAFLLTGYLLHRVLDLPGWRYVATTFVGAVFIWSCYLYPLATRREVPVSLYSGLLSHGKTFPIR